MTETIIESGTPVELAEHQMVSGVLSRARSNCAWSASSGVMRLSLLILVSVSKML